MSPFPDPIAMITNIPVEYIQIGAALFAGITILIGLCSMLEKRAFQKIDR
jgi:hypothetical protein